MDLHCPLCYLCIGHDITVFVLIPNFGFPGLYHTVFFFSVSFLMQTMLCVRRHVALYICGFLNGAFRGISPLLGCCSCELHHMLFGLFHKIQMPLKITGGTYHPNAKYQRTWTANSSKLNVVKLQGQVTRPLESAELSRQLESTESLASFLPSCLMQGMKNDVSA